MDQFQQRLLYAVFRAGWEAGRKAIVDERILPEEEHISRAFVEFIGHNGLGEANDELYDVVKGMCHEMGVPWTDPRTGVTHLPPRRGR